MKVAQMEKNLQSLKDKLLEDDGESCDSPEIRDQESQLREQVLESLYLCIKINFSIEKKSFMSKLMESLQKTNTESPTAPTDGTSKRPAQSDHIKPKLPDHSEVPEPQVTELTEEQRKYLEQLIIEQSQQSMNVIRNHLANRS